MSDQHERILLVLDVDETLIHSAETELGRPADFRAFRYRVYKRPYLLEFLERCNAAFDLAVWSSGSDLYVRYVVQQIFPKEFKLHFVWGRSRATYRRLPDDMYVSSGGRREHFNYVKPLKKAVKFGWSLDRMLVVDDTPEKCADNFGNAIYPKPFEGDPTDDELPQLADYLESLKDVASVRKIEKRNWRITTNGG